MNRPLSETTRYFTDPVYRAEVDADYLRRSAELTDRVTFPAAHHSIPADERVERVMRDMGFGRMQAINHLRQRDALADKLRGKW